MSRTLQMGLFFGMGSLIVGLVHWYIWWRLVRTTGITGGWRTLATWSIVGLGLTIPLSFIFSRMLDPSIAKYALFIPYVWMAAFLNIFIILFVGEVLRLGFWGVGKAGLGVGVMPALGVWLSRGLAGAAVGVSLMVVVWGLITVAGGPRVVPVEIRMPGMGAGLDGYRVVQISDLHIGPTLDGDWLKGVVSEVNELDPDAVVITGDLVDGETGVLGPAVSELKKLRSRDGVYFSTGNHEYYSGVSQWVPFVESLGVVVLRNSGVLLERNGSPLWLAGTDDFTAARMETGHGMDVQAAVKDAPAGAPTVVLAHDPRAIEESTRAKVTLQLSGHTHGGQFWPWTWLLGLQQKYRKGLYRVSDSTQIYVNQGTGYWGPPVRAGTHGEITLITLRPDSR